MTSPAAELREVALNLCRESRFEEARDLIAAGLQLQPHDADNWLLFAKIAFSLRTYPAAQAAASRARELRPTMADAAYLLGRIHRAQGQTKEAEAHYRHALELARDDPNIMTSLAVLLGATGRAEEAIGLYHRILSCSPQHPEARAGLKHVLKVHLPVIQSRADVLLSQGHIAAARSLLLNYITLAPEDSALRVVLGRLECAHGRPEAGLEQIEEAVRLEPSNLEAIEIARRICIAGGIYDAAKRYSRLMLERAPTEEIRLTTSLLLPCVQHSLETIRASRAQYALGLTEAIASGEPLELPPALVGERPFIVASHVSFYLTYHGENNRELQMQLAQTYLKRMKGLGWTAPHCVQYAERPGRLRIGFVSRYFRKHSIGMTSRGLIDRLSRDRFEVYFLRITPSSEDSLTQSMRAAADRSLDLDPDFKQARAQIAALELDILFFQDIGMEPTSYFLGFARLAPVQCVSFGHPDTTGIPTIDYFVSNDLFETRESAAHYSERLYLLRGLPTLAYYYKPPVPDTPVSPREFGFDEAQTMYLCPQALFKLHPDMDVLFQGILNRDPQGYIVLIEGGFDELGAQLRARFAQQIPDVAHRIRFVPRLPYQNFLRLIAAADVVLDTVHFNGMNTSLETFAIGSPLVTLPGSLQRGRHTQAMYRHMNLLDAIARDPQHYVDIAVRFGTNAEYAESFRRQILERNQVLFEDPRVVEEFERFFIEAARQARERRGP